MMVTDFGPEVEIPLVICLSDQIVTDNIESQIVHA